MVHGVCGCCGLAAVAKREAAPVILSRRPLIESLRAQGKTWAEIAPLVGASLSALHRFRRRCGIPIRRHRPPRKPRAPGFDAQDRTVLMWLAWGARCGVLVTNMSIQRETGLGEKDVQASLDRIVALGLAQRPKHWTDGWRVTDA